MIRYLSVAELLFEGHENCSVGVETRTVSRPYVVIQSDPSAMCGRGLNTVYYRGREIASEIMSRPEWGIEIDGPSIGLYRDAEKWLLSHLPKIISDFEEESE